MEHRQAGARADVGTDADPDAVTIGLSEIEQAGAEKHVAGRAEGDAGAGIRHARERAVVHVDAVGENGARADQAEPVVNVQIVGGRGKRSATNAISPRFSERWLCIRMCGCAASKRPASASCSSLDVGTKRGVTA